MIYTLPRYTNNSLIFYTQSLRRNTSTLLSALNIRSQFLIKILYVDLRNNRGKTTHWEDDNQKLSSQTFMGHKFNFIPGIDLSHKGTKRGSMYTARLSTLFFRLWNQDQEILSHLLYLVPSITILSYLLHPSTSLLLSNGHFTLFKGKPSIEFHNASQPILNFPIIIRMFDKL